MESRVSDKNLGGESVPLFTSRICRESAQRMERSISRQGRIKSAIGPTHTSSAYCGACRCASDVPDLERRYQHFAAYVSAKQSQIVIHKSSPSAMRALKPNQRCFSATGSLQLAEKGRVLTADCGSLKRWGFLMQQNIIASS